MPNQKPRILLIYTGGTIGMIREMNTGALVPFQFDNLLESIPELVHIQADISSLSFPEPIDSSNMNPEVWIQLAEILEVNYHNYDGFVVLHGSDTMAYTASALSFMLNHLAKPVIFTGSQLPIGIIRTDGKENLITAIEIAAARIDGQPVVPEVAIYFEYKLYRGNRTYKDNAAHFEAFRSPNYPVLANAGIEIDFNFDKIRNKSDGEFQVKKVLSNRVALIKLFPGIGKEFLSCVIHNPAIDILIFESYGAGNMPTDKNFTNLIAKASEQGKILLNITQCHKGTVTHGLYETSNHLDNLGVISGRDLTAEAAITKAMYLLGNHHKDEVKALLKQSLAGEMS
jgi:L-asparaginase